MAAMRKALAMPASSRPAVDYINAHATARPWVIFAETTRLEAVLAMLSRRCRSADQEHDGTLPDGCGRRRSAHMPDCHERQALPPTINLDDPDPECRLCHVANEARPHQVRVRLEFVRLRRQHTCLVLKAV